MNTLFLINPGAGRRRNPSQLAELIRAIYQNAGQPCEIWPVNFARLDEDLAIAQRRGFDRIFAVGGDGTINAIGTRLIGTEVAMGVIPGGSGNGLGRHMGMSVKMVQAIQQSLHLRSRRVDTATLGKWPFLNLAGLGIDASVAHSFANASRRGLAPYVRHTARGLLQFSTQTIDLELNGEWHTFHDVVGLVVANGTQWGYAAKIAAGSSLTDGLLDVRIVRRFPLVLTPPLLVRLFNGSLHASPYLTAFRTPALRIRRAEPGLAQVDGEPVVVEREVAVSVRSQSLKLLLPIRKEV
jgi:diacylglycerol kinase (ATP)